MKRTLLFTSVFVLMLSFSFAGSNNAYAAMPAIFDINVISNPVTDTYDYSYTLYYANYDPLTKQMRGISHWWLEISCAHTSISGLYGYTMLGGVRYDWEGVVELPQGGSIDQVNGYTDWIIKWNTPDGLEIPVDGPNLPSGLAGGGLIGYFGFHSTQPPIDGIWGGKAGGNIFDTGTAVIPRCVPNVPEPASLTLLGLGLLGLFGFRKRIGG